MVLLSPFPTMFSPQSVTRIIIRTTFKMLSANAFKLDWSQILSFGIELSNKVSDWLNHILIGKIIQFSQSEVLSLYKVQNFGEKTNDILENVCWIQT